MTFDAFMQGGGWGLLALGAAAFSAVFFLVNQYYRLPGYLLVFWMRVGGVIILTPLMTQVVWPQNPAFYMVVGVTVLLVTYADARIFDVAARYGGGMVSRLQPLSVWGAFLCWLVIDPDLIGRYLDRPLNAAGIVATLSGCVWFAMRMNRSPVNRAAFGEMAPALVALAIIMALNKYAMSLGPMHSTVYAYMYVQCALMTLSAGGFAFWRLSRPVPLQPVTGPTSRAALPVAAGIMTVALLLHMVQKNYAMVYAANPSYVGAIGLTAPVFIAGWYWLKNHKEQEEVWSGYGIVACAAVLVLLTVR